MRVKDVCCVRERDVRMIPKIIDNQPMLRMSEYRFRLGNCGRWFLSLAIYKCVSAKIIAISGSMFWSLRNFGSSSNDAVHLPQLTSWLHWYRCFIVSGVTPQCRQKLVVACLCCYSILMVGRVLPMHFVMKCIMWVVVISCACLNNVRSISSQSAMWVRLRSYQCWSSRRLEILYVIDWAMLEWTGVTFIDILGIPCGFESLFAIVNLLADESRNSAIIYSAS